MFALESLAWAGETYPTSSRVKKACDFIVSKQMPDGGWGESYKACELGEWVDADQSLVINTAWAVMCLLVAKYTDHEVIKRGCRLIMSRQKRNGEWVLETTVSCGPLCDSVADFLPHLQCGIFNRSCSIGELWVFAVDARSSLFVRRLSEFQANLDDLGARQGCERAGLEQGEGVKRL